MFNTQSTMTEWKAKRDNSCLTSNQPLHFNHGKLKDKELEYNEKCCIGPTPQFGKVYCTRIQLGCLAGKQMDQSSNPVCLSVQKLWFMATFQWLAPTVYETLLILKWYLVSSTPTPFLKHCTCVFLLMYTAVMECTELTAVDAHRNLHFYYYHHD